MSALALRKLQDPHFEDENEIVKHLRNKVKNGLDYTIERIGIDYEKAPKIPTFKGPDLSSIRFESFKEKDYFGNSWLLNTDYKFGRDPNNPFLKDFKFKTFDSTGIFHKSSPTDAGVKDALAHIKTNESKHGDITGYVNPIAANLDLQNKTWDDIAEGKKQVEDLTADITRDALDSGFINQMKMDRLKRRSKTVLSAEHMQAKVLKDTTNDIISTFDPAVANHVDTTRKGIYKDKRKGVFIEPIVNKAIPILANAGRVNVFKKQVEAERIAKEEAIKAEKVAKIKEAKEANKGKVEAVKAKAKEAKEAKEAYEASKKSRYFLPEKPTAAALRAAKIVGRRGTEAVKTANAKIAKAKENTIQDAAAVAAVPDDLYSKAGLKKALKEAKAADAKAVKAAEIAKAVDTKALKAAKAAEAKAIKAAKAADTKAAKEADAKALKAFKAAEAAKAAEAKAIKAAAEEKAIKADAKALKAAKTAEAKAIKAANAKAAKEARIKTSIDKVLAEEAVEGVKTPSVASPAKSPSKEPAKAISEDDFEGVDPMMTDEVKSKQIYDSIVDTYANKTPNDDIEGAKQVIAQLQKMGETIPKKEKELYSRILERLKFKKIHKDAVKKSTIVNAILKQINDPIKTQNPKAAEEAHNTRSRAAKAKAAKTVKAAKVIEPDSDDESDEDNIM